MRTFPTAELSQSSIFTEYAKKSSLALTWLLNCIHETPGRLWSPYTFSNSYVIYGIASARDAFEAQQLNEFVCWYKKHQGKHGGYEDTEDTALAILALSSIMKYLALDGDAILSRVDQCLPHSSCVAPKCFLGYSSGSKAVALEIKDFLRHMISTVDIKDWKWDFDPGKHLFTELDEASKECKAAVFLVTRDDELTSAAGPSQASPRDNIIFEVGFFGARLGIENTILIVEEGTKTPTDWGGILYIPMAERQNLDSVKLQVLTALKRIFRIKD